MPHDIEELVRRSLETRAQDVRLNPETWQRVQSRVRRERWLWLGAVAATAAAAALLAVVVIPTALHSPDVAFPPVGQPPAAPASFCQSPADIAAVYAAAGGLHFDCVSGMTQSHVERDVRLTNPDIAPDGTWMVFEREASGSSTINYLDLRTGEEHVLGSGMLPATAPDGRVAWVQQEEGGPGRIVGGRPFNQEIEFSIPVDEWVIHLAWDTVDDYLLYEAVDGEGQTQVWAVEIETGRHVSLDGRYFSPAVAPDGTMGVLSDSGTRLEFGFLDRSLLRGDQPSFEFLTEIGQVGSEHMLASAGYLTRQDGRWVRADRPSWVVVVDGTLTLVDADGRTHWLRDDVQSVAVNPAPDLGPPPESEPVTLEPQALPHDVGVTRQRIYDAATAGEFGALRELMAPDFTYSFGGSADRDEAIDYLSENPELLDVIAGLLGLPYGVVTPEDPEYFVWPWVFADGPEALWPEFRDQLAAAAGEQQVAELEQHGEWLGWRIGIDKQGVWRYFVAGD